MVFKSAAYYLLKKEQKKKTAGKPQYQVWVFISASRVSGAKISLPEAPIEINFACFFFLIGPTHNCLDVLPTGFLAYGNRRLPLVIRRLF